MAAELIHNLVDLTASVAVPIGLHISQRTSRACPYGLYKVENVVAVGVALLIFFTSCEIAREALFAGEQVAVVNAWVLAGVALSALVPLDRIAALAIVVFIGKTGWQLLVDGIRVLLHCEPRTRTHVRFAVPLGDPAGGISPHFGEAPCPALVTVRTTDGLIEHQEVHANPHLDEEKAKGIRVSE